jgi:hypothetical protein
VKMLYDLDNEKLAELREVCTALILPSSIWKLKHKIYKIIIHLLIYECETWSHSQVRAQTEGVWDQNTEENIGSNRHADI